MSDEPPHPLAEHVLELLKLANNNGKFAIQLGHAMSYDRQNAFEWMLMNDWIRLIDVTALSHGPGGIFRVYRAMPVAMAFRTRMETH